MLSERPPPSILLDISGRLRHHKQGAKRFRSQSLAHGGTFKPLKVRLGGDKMAQLQEVFKTGGVPTVTFVKPLEYPKLILNLKTPGRGLIIEGPSGIGKTTAILKAIEETGLSNKVTKLSARRLADLEYISMIPELVGFGIVLIDDFHKLDDDKRMLIADRVKLLADEEQVRFRKLSFLVSTKQVSR
jgi:Rad3-related DNA helicase